MFVVVNRSLYSPGELHWCKAGHLQTRLLNQDLSSEIFAWVIQHLLGFRKKFPQKHYELVMLRLSYIAFFPQLCSCHCERFPPLLTGRIQPTYLYFHYVKCYWLFSVFTQPESRQLLDELGPNGKGRITLVEQLLSEVSYYLLKFPFPTLWPFTAWVLAWYVTNFMLKRQHPCNTTVFMLKEHFGEEIACFLFIYVLPKFLFGQCVMHCHLGLSRPYKKKNILILLFQVKSSV